MYRHSLHITDVGMSIAHILRQQVRLGRMQVQKMINHQVDKIRLIY
jgi:hypothetical protein